VTCEPFPCRKSDPDVLVVETAEDRPRKNPVNAGIQRASGGKEIARPPRFLAPLHGVYQSAASRARVTRSSKRRTFGAHRPPGELSPLHIGGESLCIIGMPAREGWAVLDDVTGRPKNPSLIQGPGRIVVWT
jgi:hypothetical protein